MAKRRAYLLIEGRDETPKEAYTSFKKIYDQLSEKGHIGPYHTIYRRFNRAKEKGLKSIVVEVDGKEYTIEVQDLN